MEYDCRLDDIVFFEDGTSTRMFGQIVEKRNGKIRLWLGNGQGYIWISQSEILKLYKEVKRT